MKSSSHKHPRNSSSSAVRSRRQKNKSKKHRRRDVSISCSDSDPRSDSSLSISSSNSKDGFRSRKTMRARDTAKRTTKRARRSSSSSSSEGRALAHRRHHRHRNKSRSESKQSAGSDKRKRSLKKKRVKARSPSSESHRSCSTCWDSSSSGDSEIERSRRSGGGKFSTRGRSHQQERTRRRRHRSRSCLSLSCSGRSSRSRGRSKERLIEESFPRRLGSVITVVKDLMERDDENKAEIIPAYDDCPSSRSNDSYEGVRKREIGSQLPDQNSQHALEKKRRVDEKDEYDNDFGRAQPGWNDPPLMEKKNEVSVDVGSSEIEDLESLLRQKALENFKRFRSSSSKSLGNQKDGSGVSKQLTAKGESTQSGDAKIVGLPLNGKSAIDLENCGRDHDGHESKSKSALNPLPGGESVGINNKSIQGTLTFRPDSSRDRSIHRRMHLGKSEQVANDAIGAAARLNENQHIEKEELTLGGSTEKLSEQSFGTKNIPDKKVGEIPKAAAAFVSRSMHGVEVKKGDGSGPTASSCLDPVARDCASSEPKAEEIKGGSQYEQKTMSVMRGGEMVQVSYKVYIPKKAPALARRQLQR
ncbi:DEAD-box ATP-dependent RNA helicase 42 [Magnolia sinica]|uniref:DEAD-box ATP-dependent RNA helicase 42 n=1 Tax=Magnolia sinica TaxID=86752 RepID=UPI0026581F48|nr:DEAD-box ATP-dependent RNA helicase 42 [Magnolia sinica]